MITNLLSKAIKARHNFAQIIARREASSGATNTVFICHLLEDEDNCADWQNNVEPFMQTKCGGYNNIASYVANLVTNGEDGNGYDKSIMQLLKQVRIKWLSDLVDAAETCGDAAEFPPIMNDDEIKAAYAIILENK